MSTNGAAPGNASPIPPNGAANHPTPEDAARISGFLREHPSWTAFWDKRECLWRVTEDDPDSALYAASSEIGTVIAFMTEHA